MHDIRVCVVDWGRTFLYMRYIDPQTGKAVEKSTGERKRRDAERVAAKFEHDLRNGRYVAPSRILWSDFRERFEAEHMAGQFATAHGLRRSFGTRWAARVKPATLQRLMRHRDIKTTMDFYVDQDADDIATELWAIHKNARQALLKSDKHDSASVEGICG